MELSEKALAELEKLGELKASGVLTDEEFARLKEEIFSRTTTPSGYRLVLIDGGADKIRTIKLVRELTSLGLKEAKDLVDRAPRSKAVLGVFRTRETVELHEQRFLAAGARTFSEELFSELPDEVPPVGRSLGSVGASNAVMVQFDDVSHPANRGCKIMMNGQEVARCEAGESLSVEIDGPTEIQVKFAGGFGKPSVLANPGDCFTVSYGKLGKTVIEQA